MSSRPYKANDTADDACAGCISLIVSVGAEILALILLYLLWVRVGDLEQRVAAFEASGGVEATKEVNPCPSP